MWRARGLVWRAVEGAGPRATSDVPLVAVEAELHFHSRLELPTPGLISRRVNSIGEGLTQWQSELGYPVADQTVSSQFGRGSIIKKDSITRCRENYWTHSWKVGEC